LFLLILAPVVVKSLLQDCCSFSWQKKATIGSSFFALEKHNKTKKLAADNGKMLLIKKDKNVYLCAFKI
jgi:hypothetical protein